MLNDRQSARGRGLLCTTNSLNGTVNTAKAGVAPCHGRELSADLRFSRR
jgi:hypothetical protein